MGLGGVIAGAACGSFGAEPTPSPADAASDASEAASDAAVVDAPPGTASVACNAATGATTCAPGELCCIVWALAPDFCADAATPCSSPAGPTTEMRCDDPTDCASNEVCCGRDVAGKTRVEARCELPAACDVGADHRMCTGDEQCASKSCDPLVVNGLNFYMACK